MARLAAVQSTETAPEPSYEWVETTPAVAEEWLTHADPENRNIRPSKVDNYVRDMESGAWNPYAAIPITFDYTGRLINGHHRLTAQVEAGATLMWMVWRDVPPETREVFDQGANRGARDVLKFHGVDTHTSSTATTLRILETWRRGKYTRANTNFTLNLTNSEVLDLLDRFPGVEDLQPEAKRLSREITLSAPDIASVIYMTRRIAPASDVSKFWRGVEGLDATTPTDPRYVLRRWASGRERLDGGRTSTSLQLFAILSMWNAWRQGKTRRSIQPIMSREVRDDLGLVIKNAVYSSMPKPI